MDELTYETDLESYGTSEEECFAFLDQIRDSGVTNMFGASPYLTEMFDLRPALARHVLSRWMKTFGDRHP
jgi:hypothetical protein